jgi:hypothetical protein
MSRLIAITLFLCLIFLFSGCGGNNEETDTQPPSVSLIAPLNGDHVSNTLVISATASDNEGISFVNFYLGDSLIASISNTPYTTTFDISAFADQTVLSVCAVAFDLSNNSTKSDTAFVTVNQYSEGFTLSSSDLTSNSVRLIWNRFNGSFSYYVVKQSLTSGVSEHTPTILTIYGINDTTALITGLTHSTDYYYRVFAVRPNGSTTPTNEIRLRTDEEVIINDTMMIFIPSVTFTRAMFGVLEILMKYQHQE